MKKLTILLAAALISCGCYAQKANVNKAKNAAFTADNPDFNAAREFIAPALEDVTTSEDANTWFVAGQIGYKEYEYLDLQRQIGKAIDPVVKGEAIIESIKYWTTADELAMIPNAKGKVNTALRKKIANYVLEYYTRQELLIYGSYLNENKEYADAYRVFYIHLAIPDMPFMQDEKLQAKMPKDTIYQQYRYYAGCFAAQAEMHPQAIAIFEEMKDGDYEGIRINQLLYQEYLALQDTVNYVRVLLDASNKFPQEPWFLQNLINHYIFSGQEAAAIEFLQTAIEREPNVAQYHHILGNLLENAKRYDEALASYDRALAIDRTYADAEAGKGRVFYNQAVKMNEDASLLTDNKAYYAALAEANKMFEKSIPFFEVAHHLEPANRDYMITLKTLYYRLKMDDKYEAIVAEMNQ